MHSLALIGVTNLERSLVEPKPHLQSICLFTETRVPSPWVLLGAPLTSAWPESHASDVKKPVALVGDDPPLPLRQLGPVALIQVLCKDNQAADLALVVVGLSSFHGWNAAALVGLKDKELIRELLLHGRILVGAIAPEDRAEQNLISVVDLHVSV